MDNIQQMYIKRIEDNAVWTKLDKGTMIIMTADIGKGAGPQQDSGLSLGKERWLADGRSACGTPVPDV